MSNVTISENTVAVLPWKVEVPLMKTGNWPSGDFGLLSTCRVTEGCPWGTGAGLISTLGGRLATATVISPSKNLSRLAVTTNGVDRYRPTNPSTDADIEKNARLVTRTGIRRVTELGGYGRFASCGATIAVKSPPRRRAPCSATLPNSSIV